MSINKGNVVNVKNKSSKYDVYVGRENKTYNLKESKWANPFVIGVDGDREEVLRKYTNYIYNKKELYDSLEELDGKILGCWCYPAHCHADVLINLLNEKKLIKYFDNLI